MTLYRCQPKRSQNDSLEGVVLGSRKRLFRRSQNDSFEFTVYNILQLVALFRHKQPLETGWPQVSNGKPDFSTLANGTYP